MLTARFSRPRLDPGWVEPHMIHMIVQLSDITTRYSIRLIMWMHGFKEGMPIAVSHILPHHLQLRFAADHPGLLRLMVGPPKGSAKYCDACLEP